MSYSVKDPSGYNAAMCMIYIVDKGTSLEAEGGFPEVTIDTTGPGVTELVKDAGEYYLDVKAANCQWTVTIQELR